MLVRLTFQIGYFLLRLQQIRFSATLQVVEDRLNSYYEIKLVSRLGISRQSQGATHCLRNEIVLVSKVDSIRCELFSVVETDGHRDIHFMSQEHRSHTLDTRTSQQVAIAVGFTILLQSRTVVFICTCATQLTGVKTATFCRCKPVSDTVRQKKA